MIGEDQPPLSDTVVKALNDGKMIEAIKQIRVERGLGLKEAKDVAEEYIKTRPELAGMYAQQQSKGKLSLFLILVVIVLAIIGIMRH